MCFARQEMGAEPAMLPESRTAGGRRDSASRCDGPGECSVWFRVIRLLLVFALLSQLPAAAAGPSAPGRLVDVGERRLHLACVGSGSPTIVFQSGLGEGWYSWVTIQEHVGRDFRACAYDRAGIGFSDPGPFPRTNDGLADDLHALLALAGERPPFVLVGHSLGGFLVRRFANRYPELVCGLVLVDSSGDDGWKYTPSEVTAETRRRVAARAEQIRRWRATNGWEEMGFPDAVPAGLQALLAPRTRTAAWWDARFAEIDMCDGFEESTAKRRLEMPLVVITATRWPKLEPLSDAVNERWQRARLAGQADLAARSPVSTHVRVDTGHYVHHERPEVVIDAIRKVAALAAEREGVRTR
jgi:pimeloyl-ACP methyl ester carboxylesterase